MLIDWIKNKLKKKQTTRAEPTPEEPLVIELTEVYKEPIEEDPLDFIEKITFNEYKFTPSAIEDHYKKLRPHQVRAVEELEGKDIGQINHPTGTGKTYVQKYIHVKDMVEKTKAGDVGVYAIAAHRLILCSQLFDEIIKLVVTCGLKTDLLYIGSGSYPFDVLNDKYKAFGFDKDTIDCLQTTSSEAAAAFVAHAGQKGNHVLIVATYHSFDCLRHVGNIDICTFDEAHTTVEDRFKENIETVWDNIKRKFFFTATRKVIGETLGQNNTAFYGEVFAPVSPREAIEAGEIVAPHIHIVRPLLEDNIKVDKANIGMKIKTVIESFNAHEERVKEASISPETIAGKLLVTNSGLDEIRGIVSDDFFRSWCSEKNINVFSFSSKDGEAHNFDNNISREKILQKMDALKSHERAILFHYDILTEGIDLPGITGVMLMRSTIPFIKLLQNLGRACRLHPDDRKKLYAGEIVPGQHGSMVKPYSWAILPVYLNDHWQYVQDIISNLRISYDIPVENVAITDLSTSDKDFDPESLLEKDSARRDLLDEIEHVFETVEICEFEEALIHVNKKTKYAMEYIRTNGKVSVET
jgi:predicted helicase